MKTLRSTNPNFRNKTLWQYRLVLALFCSLFLGDSGLQAGLYQAWTYRAPISFNLPVNGSLTNFPAPILLGPSITNFNYSQVLDACGADLRFASADELTPLNFEIEQWNTGGQSVVWVQIPALTGTHAQIWAYWGRATNAPPCTTNGSVWNPLFGGVWHLSSNTTHGQIQSDSTVNRADATFYDANGNSQAGTNGLIGGAVHLAGDADFLQITNTVSLQPTNQLSFGLWAKSDTLTWSENGCLISKRDVYILHPNSGLSTIAAYGHIGGWNIVTYDPAPIDTWHLYYAVYNGTVLQLYLDGVEVGRTPASGPISSDSGSVCIGQDDGLPRYLKGWIDEPRISTVALSSNWMWATWFSVQSNSQFVAYGAAELIYTNLGVEVRPASALTLGQATLNGEVMNAGGTENPHVYFCWGGSDFGTGGTGAWPFASALGTNWGTHQAFSLALNNLSPGTTYHFRAYVTNSTGADWSDTAESFTLPHPPVVTNPGASQIRHFSAQLNANLTDAGSQNPTLFFDYWPSSGSATSRLSMGTQPTGLCFAVAPSLEAGVDYAYRVVASNGGGSATSSIATFTTRAYGCDWYVATNGNHSDATNWATAFTNIQIALNLATSNDVIRLAGHLFASPISLVWTASHVSVIGGYEATTPSLPGSQDPAIWPTLITRTSGSVTRLMSASGLTNGVLEGLIFSNGYLSGYMDGPGLWISNASLYITNCAFITNRADSGVNQYNNGGGIYALNSTLHITHCLFDKNVLVGGAWLWNGGAKGAGLYAQGGQCVVEDSDFIANRSDGQGNQGGYGGGLHFQSGNHRVTQCRFFRNIATGRNGYGGAISLDGAKVAFVDRGLFVSNSANWVGGGIYMTGGNIRNSLICNNVVAANLGCSGGGVYMTGGSLENCTLAQNSSTYNDGGLTQTGGGVTNTIVYYNLRTDDQADANVGKSGGTCNYSCTTPSVVGDANLDDDPQFKDRIGGDFTIQAGSTCLDSGTNDAWMSGTPDLSGLRARIIAGTVDRGCYESDPASGPLSCNFIASPTEGLDAVDVVLSASLGGSDTHNVFFEWDLNNNGLTDFSGTNLYVLTNQYKVGTYGVKLTVHNGSAETDAVIKDSYIHVAPSHIYVATNGNHTLGTNWATAYRDIQSALDVALSNSTLHLAGHQFGIATRLSWSGKPNLTLRGGYKGVGPALPGLWDPDQWPTVIARTSGSTRILIINQLSTGLLEHVTITGGNVYDHGAGIRISDSLITLQDCMISNNIARGSANTDMRGGGIYSYGSTALIRRCSLIQNSVRGEAGSWNGTSRGGGLYVLDGSVLLENCLIASNSVNCVNLQGSFGGGVYFAGGNNGMRSCLVVSNQTVPASRGHHGGGVYLSAGSAVENCTIVDNSITEAGDSGAGIYRAGGQVTNTIIWANHRAGMEENVGGAISAFWYSCAPELVNSENFNLPHNPEFAITTQGVWSITQDSPCSDAGAFAPWMADAQDLDGNPRVRRRVVDIGAFESRPGDAGLVLRLF